VWSVTIRTQPSSTVADTAVKLSTPTGNSEYTSISTDAMINTDSDLQSGDGQKKIIITVIAS